MSSAAGCVAFLLCLLLAGGAGAAGTVSATGVNFGAYDVFAPTPLDPPGTAPVTGDQGPPPGGWLAPRRGRPAGGVVNRPPTPAPPGPRPNSPRHWR